MNQSVKQHRPNGKSTSFTSNKARSQQPQQLTEERQARIESLIKQLEEGVASIQSSADFRRWLNFASRFHTYSLNNQLLILMQFPTATRVAGYRKWQSLGRQVKRGERGISILAPVPYERKVVKMENDEGSSSQAGTAAEEVRRGIAFRSVSVFDVSQTEGEPLPELTPEKLEGQSGEELYQRLVELADQEGLLVTNRDVHLGSGGGEEGGGGISSSQHQTDYNGYYLPSLQLIYVKEAARSQMVKTLAHELGHHFDHSREESNRDERETVAEAVAFVVTSHFGIDTTAYTFPYVAGWAAQREGSEIIRAVMTRIVEAAHSMLDRLSEEGDQEDLSS